MVSHDHSTVPSGTLQHNNPSNKSTTANSAAGLTRGPGPRRLYFEEQDVNPRVGELAKFTHCIRCWELRHGGFMLCDRKCHYCQTYDHVGEACKYLYVSQNWWKKHYSRHPPNGANVKGKPHIPAPAATTNPDEDEDQEGCGPSTLPLHEGYRIPQSRTRRTTPPTPPDLPWVPVSKDPEASTGIHWMDECVRGKRERDEALAEAERLREKLRETEERVWKEWSRGWDAARMYERDIDQDSREKWAIYQLGYDEGRKKERQELEKMDPVDRAVGNRYKRARH